jgi:signal peptidase I
LLVFDSSGIRGLEPGSIFIKRLVGLPGDRLRISGNQLFVNGQATVYTDTEGKPIHYIQAGSFLRIPTDEIVLPPDCFFVLGDNSKNSFDSRYWGQVPRANIRGRAWFRYWPLR